MRNIALKLMYNGTAYHGWQMQRTEASVQETLQRGLSMVCGERVRLTGVGRTDAGVHAERYVANFRTSSRIPIDRLPFAVNTHTPEDIVVREALEVADDFNAIGSCLKKEYTYRIYNSRIKNPFYVNRAYFYPKKLDEAVMDAAARAFEGTHDFRAVRSVGTETKTTVRTVHHCRVTRRGELLELKVCADGFLYNMVRAITGTVLYAAEGDGGRVELDLLRVDLAAVVGEHAHARGGNDQQAVAEEGEAVRAVVVVIIGVLARGVGLIVAQRAAEAVEIRQVQIRRGEHRSQHDREHRHQHQNTVERAAARRRGAVRTQIFARELILVSH